MRRVLRVQHRGGLPPLAGNRTFNLLIAEQSAKSLLFQRLLDFHSGQKWAILGVVDVMKDVTSFEP